MRRIAASQILSFPTEDSRVSFEIPLGQGATVWGQYYQRVTTVFVIASLLSGCGTTTPSIHEFYDTVESDALISHIIEHTNCELREAVLNYLVDLEDLSQAEASVQRPPGAPSFSVPTVDLRKWAAQLTLVMTVDEKSNLTPSIAITPPLRSVVSTFSDMTTTTTTQSASYGFGLNGSVEATRKGTVSWLVDFSTGTDKAALDVIREKRAAERKSGKQPASTGFQSSCAQGPFIEGDLKLHDWLTSSMLETNVNPPPAQDAKSRIPDFGQQLAKYASQAKKDVFQNEITFIVLYSGNFNPVWKLLRVSADSSSVPLFGMQRTRTQDLLITMGPSVDGKLATEAQNQDLASKIAAALRGTPLGQ